MWRKNRQPNANSRCVGTDQNRNFGKNFGGGGASNDPCSELYHGPEAFSAVENAHYRDRILQLKDRLKILYSIHNYSQFWMHPWGWTEQLPEDYALMVSDGFFQHTLRCTIFQFLKLKVCTSFQKLKSKK